MSLAGKIRTYALGLGFDAVGIAPAGRPITFDRYRKWLKNQYHGEMVYLARPDAQAKRADPSRLLPGIRSVITVAANYHSHPLPRELRDVRSLGVFASYAWGVDYHTVLMPRLRQLGGFVNRLVGAAVDCRVYLDTGPILEREIAARAGLGFVGKNTNLIHPRLGSWLLLGELLVPEKIPTERTTLGTDAQSGDLSGLLQQGTCGRCTRCLDACPTGAFVAPYVLDSRRCISYLTIELKGPVPTHLRPLLGNRVFGCDVCQEVCPWNRRFARATAEEAFRACEDATAPSLLDLMALNDEGFRRRFRETPAKRAKRRGLLRNVAVALGNWADPAAVPALARALHDEEPLIRGHAAWALGRIPGEDAQSAVERALAAETDEWVRDELRQALEGCRS